MLILLFTSFHKVKKIGTFQPSNHCLTVIYNKTHNETYTMTQEDTKDCIYKHTHALKHALEHTLTLTTH